MRTWIFVTFVTILALPLSAQEPSEPEELPGVTVEREDGSRLNLRVEDQKFIVRIYDEKKNEALPIPFSHAVLRYEGPRVDREVLRLDVGEDFRSLTTDRFAPRPYNFFTFLMLYEGDQDEPVEKYPLRLRQ